MPKPAVDLHDTLLGTFASISEQTYLAEHRRLYGEITPYDLRHQANCNILYRTQRDRQRFSSRVFGFSEVSRTNVMSDSVRIRGGTEAAAAWCRRTDANLQSTVTLYKPHDVILDGDVLRNVCR